jgi:hypothetical protein
LFNCWCSKNYKELKPCDDKSFRVDYVKNWNHPTKKTIAFKVNDPPSKNNVDQHMESISIIKQTYYGLIPTKKNVLQRVPLVRTEEKRNKSAENLDLEIKFIENRAAQDSEKN